MQGVAYLMSGGFRQTEFNPGAQGNNTKSGFISKNVILKTSPNYIPMRLKL